MIEIDVKTLNKQIKKLRFIYNPSQHSSNTRAVFDDDLTDVLKLVRKVERYFGC